LSEKLRHFRRVDIRDLEDGVYCLRVLRREHLGGGGGLSDRCDRDLVKENFSLFPFFLFFLFFYSIDGAASSLNDTGLRNALTLKMLSIS